MYERVSIENHNRASPRKQAYRAMNVVRIINREVLEDKKPLDDSSGG